MARPLLTSTGAGVQRFSTSPVLSFTASSTSAACFTAGRLLCTATSTPNFLPATEGLQNTSAV